MAQIDIDTALEWRGRKVVDRDGEKVGTLKEIYLDEHDRPAWASVHTALFGLRDSLVPLADAREAGGEVQVPYSAAHVKDAPNVDPDVQLSDEEQERLYRHYELGGDEPARGGDEPAREGTVAAADAPPADEAARAGEAPGAGDDAMTRSEEEVHVAGTEWRPRERLRIKKYLVTEHVKKTVPVRREEVRLEHDPPPDGER